MTEEGGVVELDMATAAYSNSLSIIMAAEKSLPHLFSKVLPARSRGSYEVPCSFQ